MTLHDFQETKPGEQEAGIETKVATVEEEEEGEGLAKRRKMDQLETNRQPTAPECPVCAIFFNFHFSLFNLLLSTGLF